METRTITRVNNVEIVATSDEQLVPIRPICDALGIDYSRQLKKIKEDPDLSSVMGVTPTTGADGKQYEMCCLPLEFTFGWLFTINPANVKPEAQEAVRKFRMECYHALYLHFTARSQFVEQKQKEIDRQLTVVEEARENFRNAKNVMADAETKLKKLRSLTMDDFDAERRQLKLEF
ncbi:MAG: phage antirepressor N-terminal domain-containing protein [Bacteroides sp.]|nr:phage antirepressor N-terminal domain-containing protein [Bacteroides sp.]